MVLESLRQPVINGYLIAGSIVGPGGLQLVKVTNATCKAWRHLSPDIGAALTLASKPTALRADRGRLTRWVTDTMCSNTMRRPARVQELVQVESLAQIGVQLLLFTLGLGVQPLQAARCACRRPRRWCAPGAFRLSHDL